MNGTREVGPSPVYTPLTITTTPLKGRLRFYRFFFLPFCLTTNPLQSELGPQNLNTDRVNSSHQWPTGRYAATVSSQNGWLLLPSWNLLLSPVFCCPSTISGSWPSTMCLFLQIPDLISPLLCSFHICADVSYLYNSFIIYFYALILPYFFYSRKCIGISDHALINEVH